MPSSRSTVFRDGEKQPHRAVSYNPDSGDPWVTLAKIEPEDASFAVGLYEESNRSVRLLLGQLIHLGVDAVKADPALRARLGAANENANLPLFGQQEAS